MRILPYDHVMSSPVDVTGIAESVLDKIEQNTETVAEAVTETATEVAHAVGDAISDATHGSAGPDAAAHQAEVIAEQAQPPVPRTEPEPPSAGDVQVPVDEDEEPRRSYGHKGWFGPPA